MENSNSKKEAVNGIIKALIAFVVGMIVNKTMESVTPRFISDYIIYQFINEAVFAAVVIFFLIIYRKTSVMRGNFTGISKGVWPAVALLATPVIAILTRLGSVKISVRTYDVILAVIFFFLIGVAEEFLFRGIIQNAFHDYFGEDTRGHIIKAIVVASVIFGSTHMLNAISPDIPFSAAAVQAASAIMSGLIFGTIYYRTHKCIWFNALLHGLYDGILLIAGGIFAGESATKLIGRGASDASTGMGWVGIAWEMLVPLVIFLVISRKKKIEVKNPVKLES